MCLHCSLKIQNLISPLSIIDEQVLCLLATLSLSFVVGLGSKWKFLYFFPVLFRPRLSYYHFLFLPLLDSTLVQSFTIVNLWILRQWHWWSPCSWSTSLSWLDLVDLDLFKISSLEWQIWIRISVRVRPPHLLLTLHFLHCTPVKPLMDRATVEFASLSLSLLLFLLHDMPRSCRDGWSVHCIARWPSIL